MGKQPNWEAFLIEVLREEIASREAELDALRGSLRYQIGSWALEALPPGRGTVNFFTKLLRLFFARRVKRPLKASRGEGSGLSQAMLRAPTVVFGREVPPYVDRDNAWRTEDAGLVAHRLDMKNSKPGVLIVRGLSEKILRRLVRARHCGWRVVWHPEDESSSLDPALVAYICAHVDDVQDVE